MGQSTTPQGSRGWKEGKHVCDFGFIGGAGSKMTLSSMQTVYSCEKCKLLNPVFSVHKLVSSDVI